MFAPLLGSGGRGTPSYARRAPLVLINGLAEQAESWYCNTVAWRRHFDVYQPNLLAYEGAALHRRIDAGQPIDIDYLVERLHAYLDGFVQAPPYHLVANSLGGKVAVEYAARHPDQVFARMELLNQVWGYQHDGYEHTVNTHINRLRSKIEPDPANPRRLLTVWGRGYKLVDPAGAAA